MARHETTNPAHENALNASQVEFTANPAFLAPQLKHMVQAQERIFKEVEKFSSAWFQRRQEASRSMIEAGKRVVSNGRPDPASAMKELVEWQTHAMERLAEDAKCCTEMMAQCAGALVSNEVAAMEETVDTAKRATHSSKSDPV